ncbi:MAG: VWA domain-containing protein [Proteobacteria bacterium]|nr:VWA domain-containing protein [Pseudomonadota bacterium]
MHFADPHQLWWLAAVLALAVFAWHREGVRARVIASFAQAPMLARLAADYSRRRALLKTSLVIVSLALLALAAAGPQWGSRMVTVERQGVDVVFAVDCSSSMNAKDVKPSRLELARQQLGQLAHQLEGNRLGLVGFAGSAFPFCPLTLDVSATRLFLEQLDPQALPIPGTSLGDALRASLQTFPKGDPNKKVIVLLTDGEDHHSDPIGVAKEAAKAGVTVHTVGIGNPNGEPIPEQQADGRVDFVRDASGKVVMSRLDESTLRDIAKLTGGTYVHVDGSSADALSPIFSAVSGAEKHLLEETMHRRYVDRYQWFVLVALVLIALERTVSTRRPTRVAASARGAVS